MAVASTVTGADIKCYMSIKGSFIEWASLQTVSISSARSVVQVRALGNAEPIGVTRGARTYAGSLVFALVDGDILKEAFKTIDPGKKSIGTVDRPTADMLPPFNIIIDGANEQGDALQQVIYGVTLSHWGTTYSIDDLFTEVTHTYIAKAVSPVISGRIDDTSLYEMKIAAMPPEQQKTAIELLKEKWLFTFD